MSLESLQKKQSKVCKHINLYALDNENRVLQWVTLDGIDWKIDPLIKTEVASSSSGLAVTWHGYEGCRKCPNTFILVYQGINGKLQLGNGAIGAHTQF